MKRDLIPTDLYPLDKVSTHHRSKTATVDEWKQAVLSVYPTAKIGPGNNDGSGYQYQYQYQYRVDSRYIEAVDGPKFVGRYDKSTNESAIWTDENGKD